MLEVQKRKRYLLPHVMGIIEWLNITGINKVILKIYKIHIPKFQEMFLIRLNLESLPTRDRSSFWYLVIAARLQYEKLWKQKEIPTASNWIKSVAQTIEMDKITRQVREQD